MCEPWFAELLVVIVLAWWLIVPLIYVFIVALHPVKGTMEEHCRPIYTSQRITTFIGVIVIIIAFSLRVILC